MNRSKAWLHSGQLAAAICGLVLSWWIRLPLLPFIALALANACLLVLTAPLPQGFRRTCLMLPWACLSTFAISVFLGGRTFTLDAYHALLAGVQTVIAVLALKPIPPGGSGLHLRRLAAGWAAAGAVILLVTGYQQNHFMTFHLGIGLLAVLILVAKSQLHLPSILVLGLNTLVLLVIGLPVADWLTRPRYTPDPTAALHGRYFLYSKAKQDPASFAAWWRCYLDEWSRLPLFAPDPTGRLKHILQPTSHGKLFESEIAINSLGFRGKEFPATKGAVYRIVALGESTTFGCTLFVEDRPWPEILEQLINERLKLPRRVEVINAGVPAYDLQDNLLRLKEVILPLKPDMIISYHGINGFHLLDESLPKTSGSLPPRFTPRPIRLLADAEYRLQMLRYREQQQRTLTAKPPELEQPLNTRYAAAYRELIQLAETNHIRLAIATYSMAVNLQSDTATAEFFRTAAPGVHWLVRANAAHTTMLKKLAAEHPQVCLVDTHPGLDGWPDMFIDLGHFTQPGRQQMAEHFFHAIQPILEREVGIDQQPATAE